MHAHAHKVSVPGANSVLYEPLVHFRDVHPEDVGKDTASQARRSLRRPIGSALLRPLRVLLAPYGPSSTLSAEHSLSLCTSAINPAACPLRARGIQAGYPAAP